jgi:bifunctional DNA-binding transcriptional regulator/antitoxin component of YhaV-PrlF toxin-antitoxin module
MQITSKGQVTIPLAIRQKMALLPHTEVTFKLKNNRVYLEKLEKKSIGEKASRGKLLIDAMRGKGTVKMTTDEIMALTRGHE